MGYHFLEKIRLNNYSCRQETGQNEYGTAIIVQYMGGELFTVYPTENASMEVAYPAKGWSER